MSGLMDQEKKYRILHQLHQEWLVANIVSSAEEADAWIKEEEARYLAAGLGPQNFQLEEWLECQ